MKNKEKIICDVCGLEMKMIKIFIKIKEENMVIELEDLNVFVDMKNHIC